MVRPVRARILGSACAVAAACALLFLVNACREGKPRLAPDPDPPAVLPASVVVLDAPTRAVLIAVSGDGSRYVFSQMTALLAGLAPDMILVGAPAAAAPDGVCGRVNSIEQDPGGDIVVRVTPAALAEVFMRARLDVEKTLTGADLDSAVPLKKGAALRLHAGAKSADLAIAFQNLVLHDADGDDATVDDRVAAAGRLVLTPAFALLVRIEDHRVVEARFEYRGGVASDLTVTAGPQAGAFHAREAVYRFSFRPMVVMLGAVPVVLRPSLTVAIGADGDVLADMQANVAQDSICATHARHDGDAWSAEGEASPAFAFSPPVASATGYLEAQTVSDFALGIYGVRGPRAARGHFMALAAVGGEEPWWRLEGGLRCTVAVEKAPFDALLDGLEEQPVVDLREALAQSEGAQERYGRVSGRVVDALSGAPVAGTLVTLRAGDVPLDAVSSGNDGFFTLTAPAGQGYVVEFAREGYLTEWHHGVTVMAGAELFLETVRQIGADAGGDGGASGRLVNALDGEPVDGAEITLRPGINALEGGAAVTTTTGAGGIWEVAGVPAGNYTAHGTRAGFNDHVFTVLIVGGTTVQNQHTAMAPLMGSDQTRIVLTWGEDPADLDAHLTGPDGEGGRFHLYWKCMDPAQAPLSCPGPAHATLDQDHYQGFGPETVTMHQRLSGVYRYSVYDYTNHALIGTDSLSYSGAAVRLYRGNALAALFHVPPGRSGNLWTVFEMDGDVIRPIHAFSDVFLEWEIQRIVPGALGDVMMRAPPNYRCQGGARMPTASSKVALRRRSAGS